MERQEKDVADRTAELVLMVSFLFRALATEISGVQVWRIQASSPTQPSPLPQPLLPSREGSPDFLSIPCC